MNIVKGCKLYCELHNGHMYFPVTIEVVNDEYITTNNNNVIHGFDVRILQHHIPPGGGYNGRDIYKDCHEQFAIGKTVAARAGDLYNGRIIEYPSNYEQLCLEKAARKSAIVK